MSIARNHARALLPIVGGNFVSDGLGRARPSVVKIYHLYTYCVPAGPLKARTNRLATRIIAFGSRTPKDPIIYTENKFSLVDDFGIELRISDCR